MSNLRTNYKDDVFTGSRKYEMTNNGDGTVSFTDQTPYTQVGDSYGAAQINEVNDIINNLDDKAYLSDDTAESDLADNDSVPFYDTSASAGKKITWVNIKNVLKSVLAIKVHSSSTASTYGAGTDSQFGHVKLSDVYLISGGAAANSVGASSAAVNSAYTKINNQLKANGAEIYMDYKNGKYGYNTSPNRGADTFHPFSDPTKFATCFPRSLTANYWSGTQHSGAGIATTSMIAPANGSVTLTAMTKTWSGSPKPVFSSVSFALRINGTAVIDSTLEYDADTYGIYQTFSFLENQTLLFTVSPIVQSGEGNSPALTLNWTWNFT